MSAVYPRLLLVLIFLSISACKGESNNDKSPELVSLTVVTESPNADAVLEHGSERKHELRPGTDVVIHVMKNEALKINVESRSALMTCFFENFEASLELQPSANKTIAVRCDDKVGITAGWEAENEFANMALYLTDATAGGTFKAPESFSLLHQNDGFVRYGDKVVAAGPQGGWVLVDQSSLQAVERAPWADLNPSSVVKIDDRFFLLHELGGRTIVSMTTLETAATSLYAELPQTEFFNYERLVPAGSRLLIYRSNLDTEQRSVVSLNAYNPSDVFALFDGEPFDPAYSAAVPDSKQVFFFDLSKASSTDEFWITDGSEHGTHRSFSPVGDMTSAGSIGVAGGEVIFNLGYNLSVEVSCDAIYSYADGIWTRRLDSCARGYGWWKHYVLNGETLSFIEQSGHSGAPEARLLVVDNIFQPIIEVKAVGERDFFGSPTGLLGTEKGQLFLSTYDFTFYSPTAPRVIRLYSGNENSKPAQIAQLNLDEPEPIFIPFHSNWEKSRTIGNRLIFRWKDETHGREFWASDGTTEGTTLLLDSNPGPAAGLPWRF